MFSRRCNRFATMARLYLGSGLPLGLPRWEARITRAPSSIQKLMVGREERIRLSSVMTMLSSMGTLKSTRMNTRLPRRSRSSIVCLPLKLPSAISSYLLLEMYRARSLSLLE